MNDEKRGLHTKCRWSDEAMIGFVHQRRHFLKNLGPRSRHEMVQRRLRDDSLVKQLDIGLHEEEVDMAQVGLDRLLRGCTLNLFEVKVSGLRGTSRDHGRWAWRHWSCT